MTGSHRLIASYIFGSVGRAQSDALSDLDVLAVVQNGSGMIAEAEIAKLIPERLLGLKLSISWYGADRLRGMFANGDLFAWHLHREAVAIFDPDQFLARLGSPSRYTECLADVDSFKSILLGIPEQVKNNTWNAAYEAGLIYVCLRNIAMASSWYLSPQPDFSRYSIFDLKGIDVCPISKKEFTSAMLCRMAGQRGMSPPSEIDAKFVLSLFERLVPWLAHLTSKLEECAREQAR